MAEYVGFLDDGLRPSLQVWGRHSGVGAVVRMSRAGGRVLLKTAPGDSNVVAFWVLNGFQVTLDIH